MAKIRERTRKNGSTYYQIIYWYQGRQGCEKFETEPEAERWLKVLDTVGAVEWLRMLYSVEAATTAITEVPTVHEICTEIIEGLTGIEKGTRNRYTRILVNDIEPFFGADSPVTVFTDLSVPRWVNHLAENVGNAAKTIANKHGVLFQLCKALVRRKLLTENPCQHTKLPRVVATEMCFLEPDEFAALLAALPQRWRLLVEFLLASGARWGEVTALRVRDINRTKLTVRIHKAWKYTGNNPVLGSPKTKKSTRTINLPDHLIARLPLENRHPDEWLFALDDGSPVRISYFYKDIWVPTRDALSLAKGDPLNGKKPRIHDLRHSCAAWMLTAGVPIHVVQAHLGHESIKTTVDVYGHLDRNAAAAAAAAIGANLAPRQPDPAPTPAPTPPPLGGEAAVLAFPISAAAAGNAA
ncbi:site-specific integrase [Nocardia terpenica]|uniref:tyrosine-type recombinase/integrase n=1 Tax=Nocardia terpenica TaxID=455432 RepID=UPI00189397FB|nr:site-specific integrase [Nocardia terpenica]MBF6062638.1 site-specific integrase [Nocardia terpenica]MBF6104726.1 site-specific integrase [Nocardia terpenica]MBF6123402.1 site-specific integrase [Nocardia terpenica]MBF6156941.1 site-specific integrase [Nocardia terpenica]